MNEEDDHAEGSGTASDQGAVLFPAPGIGRIVARVSVVIFLAELLVMLLLDVIGPPDHLLALAVVDAALLVLIASAPLYHWVVKPHEVARDHAEAALQRERDSLTSEITARRETEQRLRRLTVAVEQSPTSTVITDRSGAIVYVNRRFCELTGYRDDEVLGQNPRFQQSGQTPPETFAQLWQALIGGRHWHGEFINRKKDGSLYQEQAAIAPIFDDNGAITHYVASKFDVTERRSLEAQLRVLATTDSLTGAVNRRRFHELLEAEITRSRRYRRELAVLMLDIDHFKGVNDDFGHAVGDEVLKAVVAACVEALRESDIVGRLGGEEFGVLLPETTISSAMATAERLRRRVAEVIVTARSGPVRVTVSLGATSLSTGADDSPEILLRRADRALYRAKEAGRDRAEVVDADDASWAPSRPSGRTAAEA